MKTFFVIFVAALVSLSCNKNVFNEKDYNIKSIQATPTDDLPLAFGDLRIADILSNKDSAYIKVDNEGLVYLEYDQALESKAIGDLVVIPDKSTNSSFPISGLVPVTYGPTGSDTNISAPPAPLSFDITPEKLTEVLLKSGTLNCDIVMSPNNSNFKYAVRIDVPEFIKVGTGTPLSFTTTGASNSFSLKDYVFSNLLAKANTITLNVTLIRKQNPNSVTIAANTTINAAISFKGMEYKYVKGFLGDQSVPLPEETLNIQAFGTSFLKGATVSFKSPTVEFRVENEVGVPIKIQFSSLEARKPGSSLSIKLSSGSNNIVDLGYPKPNEMGKSILTVLTVSKVPELLSFAPSQFYYKASVHINDGFPEANTNFVTDTSKLNVHLHVTVPLWGHASNIILSDTISYDFSDADQSQITSAALKIKTNNQIPLSADLQIYLTDDKYKVLDSLISPDQTTILKGSTVTASGDLASAGVVDELIPLSKDKLDKLFKATKLIIRAKMNTTKDANGKYLDVKFKSTYKMNILLGLKVSGKIKVDL